MQLIRYKPIFTITPLKVVGAISSTLVILVTIQLGGSPTEVGLVVALSYLGNMLGILLWPHLLARKGNYVNGIILGYIFMSLSITLLATNSLLYVYVTAFLITFLTNLIYFSLLFFLLDSHKDNIDRVVGSLETVGGWSWVTGLLFGALASELLPLRELVTTLAAILFIAIILSIILLVSGLKEKIKTMVEEEEGLLPILDKGLERIIDFEDKLPSILLSGIHVIYSGALFYSPAYLIIKRPSRERLALYSGISIIFISFGFVYTQIVKHIIDLGFPESTVYLLTLVGSVLSALTYIKAGDIRQPLNRFVKAGIIRASAFLALTGISMLTFPYQIAILIAFYIVSGYTWAYLIINLNLYSLRRGKQAVGIFNFFSNIGLLIGSLSSGVILRYLNFDLLYVIAALLLLIGTLIVHLSSKKME